MKILIKLRENAMADLILRWAHMYIGTFSNDAAIV